FFSLFFIFHIFGSSLSFPLSSSYHSSTSPLFRPSTAPTRSLFHCLHSSTAPTLPLFNTSLPFLHSNNFSCPLHLSSSLTTHRQAQTRRSSVLFPTSHCGVGAIRTRGSGNTLLRPTPLCSGPDSPAASSTWL